MRIELLGPATTHPDGREAGATVGLPRSLAMMVVTPGSTHLACAFEQVVICSPDQDRARAVAGARPPRRWPRLSRG